MRKSLIMGLALAAAALFGAQPTARAGGFEYPGAGTRALGRGGAFAARADDPMALLYNPANLASLPGVQLSLNVNAAFWNACASRTGTYNEYASNPADDATAATYPGPNGNPGRVLPFYGAGPGTRFNSVPYTGGQSEFSGIDLSGIQVCNNGPPGIVPELALSWRVHDRVGIGIGVLAPAAVGHTKWGQTGGSNYGVINYNGQELPSPLRYNLIEENILMAWPTIGIGVKVHEMVNVGASVGFGFAQLNFTNMTTGIWGEQFALDILTKLHATDKFVPRINGSVQITPHDNIHIMAGVSWTQAVHAQGHLDLITGYYQQGTPDSSSTCNSPPCSYRIPKTKLTAPQPWTATLGFRYGDRIRPRGEPPPEGQIDDPMANERWDVELDAVYEHNRSVTAFNVAVPNDPATGMNYQVVINQGLGSSVPNSLTLPHNWKDQISLRLGGDWNIVPNKYAVRLGYSFESNGVRQGYQQIDFMPFQRYGLHLGGTIRVGRTDISLAYAHFFQQTQTVTDAQARIHQVTAYDTLSPGNTAAGQPPGTVVNAGRYKAHLDVISLAVNYHFR